MTYEQLLDLLESSGQNLAYLSLGRMMDIVEIESGSFPRWTDVVPDWILRNFGVK